MKYDTDALHEVKLNLYAKKSKYTLIAGALSIIVALISSEILQPYALQAYRPTFIIAYMSSLLFSVVISNQLRNIVEKKLDLKWERDLMLKYYSIFITFIVSSMLSYALEPLTLISSYYEAVTKMSIITAVLLGIVGGFENPIDLYVDFDSMSEGERKAFFSSIKAVDPSDIRYIAQGLQKLNPSDEQKKALDDIINESYAVTFINVEYTDENQVINEFIEKMGDS